MYCLEPGLEWAGMTGCWTFKWLPLTNEYKILILFSNPFTSAIKLPPVWDGLSSVACRSLAVYIQVDLHIKCTAIFLDSEVSVKAVQSIAMYRQQPTSVTIASIYMYVSNRRIDQRCSERHSSGCPTQKIPFVLGLVGLGLLFFSIARNVYVRAIKHFRHSRTINSILIW